MIRRILFSLILLSLLSVVACSPVMKPEFMKEGLRDVPFNKLRDTPDAYKGKVFILGGLIVNTRLTETGSQIEALEKPVDSLGYLEDTGYSAGRFLAFFPKSKGLLDPIIFRKGRAFTIAGEFLEAQKGKIDEMEYVYPLFEIKQVYLWEEQKDTCWQNSYPYYGPYYNAPFLYDPWGRPYYPNPCWSPP